MRRDNCNLKQKTDPENKQWYARVFEKDHSSQSKFYLDITVPFLYW